jgi:hypothetical protein
LAAHAAFSRSRDLRVDRDFKELIQSLWPDDDPDSCEEYLFFALADLFKVGGPFPSINARPDILRSIEEAIAQELVKRDTRINTLEAEKSALELRLSELHGFDVKRLGDSIVDLEEGLSRIEAIIGDKPQLQPLAESIGPMKSSVASLKAISNGMDDVYKVIIKPIQEEGKSGIRATVKWAIASIAVSTLFSILVSWFFASRG